jgi:hypothetical protein
MQIDTDWHLQRTSPFAASAPINNLISSALASTATDLPFPNNDFDSRVLADDPFDAVDYVAHLNHQQACVSPAHSDDDDAHTNAEVEDMVADSFGVATENSQTFTRAGALCGSATDSELLCQELPPISRGARASKAKQPQKEFSHETIKPAKVCSAFVHTVGCSKLPHCVHSCCRCQSVFPCHIQGMIFHPIAGRTARLSWPNNTPVPSAVKTLPVIFPPCNASAQQLFEKA